MRGNALSKTFRCSLLRKSSNMSTLIVMLKDVINLRKNFCFSSEGGNLQSDNYAAAENTL